MKKLLKLFILALIIVSSHILLAQPPDPDGDPNLSGGDELGGSAPVGSGIIILLALGVVYGGRKIYFLSKKDIQAMV